MLLGSREVGLVGFIGSAAEILLLNVEALGTGDAAVCISHLSAEEITKAIWSS